MIFSIPRQYNAVVHRKIVSNDHYIAVVDRYFINDRTLYVVKGMMGLL